MSKKCNKLKGKSILEAKNFIQNRGVGGGGGRLQTLILPYLKNDICDFFIDPFLNELMSSGAIVVE